MARIRADVGQMQSIASWLRSRSSNFGARSDQLTSRVTNLEWEGKAHNFFQENYKQTATEMRQLVEKMNQFATTLESIAESLRQADLEAARLEEEARKRKEVNK